MRLTELAQRPRIQETSYINMPVDLLQQSKTDRLQWGIVSLCVAIKCLSPSSTYIFTSMKKFRKDFHMRLDRATDLLQAIREGHSHLVRLECTKAGRTILVARSFKKMYGTEVTYRHRRTLAMTVVKVSFRRRDDLCVSKIGQEMRQLLFLKLINDKTRADELQTKGLPLTGSTSHAAHTVLSIDYLSKALGRCPRSVIRMSREARRQNLMHRYPFPLRRECDDVNRLPGYTELIVIGVLGFTRQCNAYSLTDWKLRHRFQHIIYGHRGRLTLNFQLSTKPGEPVSQYELHALYD